MLNTIVGYGVDSKKDKQEDIKLGSASTQQEEDKEENKEEKDKEKEDVLRCLNPSSRFHTIVGKSTYDSSFYVRSIKDTTKDYAACIRQGVPISNLLLQSGSRTP